MRNPTQPSPDRVFHVNFILNNPLPEGEGVGWSASPLSLWERAAKKRLSIKIKWGEGC